MPQSDRHAEDDPDPSGSGSGEAPLRLRVLSIGRGIAAGFALRQLTDLGAECSHLVWSEPRPQDWPPGTLFRSWFDAGIEKVSEDVALDALPTRLAALAESFDLVIADVTPPEIDHDALYETLEAANPAIVLGLATHFGSTGPYASWHGDELTDYALGGYWAIAGEPGREPLRVPGFQAQFHAGLALATASVAACRHARQTGEGQAIDVAAAQAMLGAHWDTTVVWTHQGRVVERSGSDIIKAKDGYVFFYNMAFYPQIAVLMNRPEIADDPRWTTREAWIENSRQFWDVVAEWCADQTVDDVVTGGQLLRIPVVGMANAETLLADPVLEERAYFRPVEGRALPGRAGVWSSPWQSADPPTRLRAALDGEPSASRSVGFGVRRSTARNSLEGLRVLELTNNWAGPLAGRHLADLGAEVIKVERFDLPATRGAFQPGNVPGKYHWNRAGYFNEMNRNKYSLSLNLTTERGKELFLELVDKSDALIENNSARVMANFGLTYGVLSARNPRLVMVSITGFGATGARRDWLAFGSNVEVATGLAAITGYDTSVPYRTGTFVADPIGGTQAALATLAGLDLAERTGHGAHVDLSLVEATLPFMLFSFTYFHEQGRLYEPNGNVDAWDAPTGAYQTADGDSWVALAVRTDAEWAALAALIGADPTLGAERSQRVQRREEIDALIREWTLTQSQLECVEALQAAGLRAAPILKNYQFHFDRHYAARSAFVRVDHPDTGVAEFPGFPWRLSATPGTIRYAAPRFGQHNDYVFGELLGLSPDAISSLYDDKVSSVRPLGYP